MIYCKATQNVIRLPTSCDLAAASYLWAKKMLEEQGDIWHVLGCTIEDCPDSFGEWLWDNHRMTSIFFIPKELIGHKWFLHGAKWCVISEAP